MGMGMGMGCAYGRSFAMMKHVVVHTLPSVGDSSDDNADVTPQCMHGTADAPSSYAAAAAHSANPSLHTNSMRAASSAASELESIFDTSIPRFAKHNAY